MRVTASPGYYDTTTPTSQRFRVHRQYCPRRPTLRDGSRARERHPCLLRSHSTPNSSRPPTYGLTAPTESREVTACRITATGSAVDRLLLRSAGYVSVAELVRISPPKSVTCSSGTTLSGLWATAGATKSVGVRAVQAAPISNCVQREASQKGRKLRRDPQRPQPGCGIRQSHHHPLALGAHVS